MRTTAVADKDRFRQLLDRDLDQIIDGKHPVNEDLIPLQSFVDALSAFASVEPSPEFLASQAHGAANATPLLHHARPKVPAPNSRNIIPRVRQRLAAGATSLMMLIGMTGVAFAADDAKPGDWNYGIDRALEAVGIGAGGAAERLQELAADQEQPVIVSDNAASIDEPTIAIADETGLQRAAAIISEITNGSQHASDVRTDVSSLLDYISEGATTDGLTVAELAHQIKSEHEQFAGQRPGGSVADEHRPDKTGRPPTSGMSGRASKPNS